MQNYSVSAAMNWFIIKVSGKINTCWNLKQIKISSTPHNLTGTHRAHIWLIASLTAELFPVGGEFVKLWLFWWVISDMRHGAAVLHSFHLCSRPRCRLCRPGLLSWQRAPFRVQPSSLWAPEIMKANPIMAMLSALITLYRNKHEIKYSRRNN